MGTGFTLVEMLVVVSLLGLLSALLLARVSRPPAATPPALASFLVQSRSEAMTDRKPVAVRIHGSPQNPVVQSSTGRQLRSAEPLAFAEEGLPAADASGGRLLVMFFADGGATAAEVAMVAGGRRLRLRVSPFTGRVTFGSDPAGI